MTNGKTVVSQGLALDYVFMPNAYVFMPSFYVIKSLRHYMGVLFLSKQKTVKVR